MAATAQMDSQPSSAMLSLSGVIHSSVVPAVPHRVRYRGHLIDSSVRLHHSASRRDRDRRPCPEIPQRADMVGCVDLLGRDEVVDPAEAADVDVRE
jgi:hypothetical protein